MTIKRSSKQKFIFVLYNIVILIFLLGLIEFSFQTLLTHPSTIPKLLLPAYRKYYAIATRNIIQREPACARYDDSLFYTLKPKTCTFSNVEFSNEFNINTLGVRDTEDALKHPEIVFLGDSFTMGWGVPQDSTFVKLLSTTTKTRMLNAGISSYGTVRELRLLERINRDSLKTLVIQYHGSDLGENVLYGQAHNTLTISSNRDYDEYVKKTKDISKYFFGKHAAFIGWYLIKDILGLLDENEKSNSNEVKAFINVLEHAAVPLGGIDLVIFETPSCNEKRKFSDILKAEIDKNVYPDYIKNIKIVNLEDILCESDYYRLDDHLKASGHKKIADKLSHILKIK